MFDIIFKAGLKTKHVEKFCGVGRVTASRWLNGHASPHPQLMGKVNKFLGLVDKAVQDGKLPFPPGIHRMDENNYLTDLFRKYLKEQKESAGALR